MTEGSILQELEKLSPHVRDRKESVKVEENNNKKWRLILEPALAGSIMAINLGQTSVQNFYLRTACTVDLNYTSEICHRGVGDEFRAVEAESQMVVSSVNISRSFVGCLLATTVLLFVGPWSDYSGRRKPLLILPLAGMSAMTTAILLMLTFPGASTMQALYFVQVPISLGGNFGLLIAASFSHVGDMCHSQGLDVTSTMGKHRAAMQIAHVFGAVGGPLLFRRYGFYGVFPIVLLLQLASLLYVIMSVKDVNVNTNNKVSVLSWKLPMEAIKCLLRPREGERRKIIILMLVVALGDRMVLSAETLIAYMYYRLKFNFDDLMFGSFLAFKNIVSFAGTLIILSILKRRLQLSDASVGVFSCISYILSHSGLIASTTTFAVFFTPIVGIISQGTQVIQRPLLNKQITPTEQGKIYSVLGALESSVQTVSAPMYSYLYSKTVSTMPDAWLIPGISLALLQMIVYLITRKLISKQNTTDNKNIQMKNIKNQSSQDLEKQNTNNTIT